MRVLVLEIDKDLNLKFYLKLYSKISIFKSELNNKAINYLMGSINH
jgi:hypothetical protein